MMGARTKVKEVNPDTQVVDQIDGADSETVSGTVSGTQ